MEMEYPIDFRCPISMELMREPVTICTGVTYERKNITKWFSTYNKTTCPATMQPLRSFDITPNHTLKRLIDAWLGENDHHHRHQSPPSTRHHDLVSLLSTIGSSPFKVTCLKKLRSIVEMGEDTKADFIQSGGVEVVVQILVQILFETSDFVTFRASEEALALLHLLPISSDHDDDTNTFDILSKPDSMTSMAIVLQRGSAEARFYAITIFKNITKTDYDWTFIIQDQGIGFFKSLLELLSDEICTKASSCALEVLIQVLSPSKKSRLKAIEAGAVCVLIELLPDSSSRSKCEKILQLVKLLCECAEGRLALVEHHMGIPAISKTLLNVSNTATKTAVKIMWLISSFHPTERVVEEMLVYGSVKKLLALLHMEGRRSSTKDKVVRMFKLHAHSWRKYPCFPSDFNHYLGLVDVSC
ncbi:hypothetical protein Ddye_018414 [Dipteronia dyeriana]|uniref:U-box domain-containing protein n=1 Tax=Dipteronia dyeriana TaxID=168575 RepID=A0AAD9X224_9ROSI|nr:hypothetical protein Ddye_018414 [Dipteronia dyeriana]